MGNYQTVVGVGIDVCGWDDIPDFDRSHPFFRLFSEEEIDSCRSRPNPIPCFAARFAAREALLKAIGGFVPWLEQIRVGHDPGGAPCFMGPVPSHLRALLSIAHSAGISTAIVVVLEEVRTAYVVGKDG